MNELERIVFAAPWASGLAEGERRSIALEMTGRNVPPGGFLCQKGAPVEYWIGVIEGLAKMSSVSPSGRTASFTGIPPGAWFGEGSVLRGGQWRYDAIALRETRVALLPGTTFNRLLDSSIAFNRFVLNQLNERLAQFIALLESERLLAPDARIARCLAWLFNPHLYPGVDQKLSLSQEEIGFLSGVSRQRVNQALRVLEEAALLRVEYGGVVVLDLEGLARFDG